MVKVDNSNENRENPDSHSNPQGNQSDSPVNVQNPENTNGARSCPSPVADNTKADIKPDFITMLKKKDRENKEEALCMVIEDAKKLIREYDIPPSEITPFEDALMNYILLPNLNVRHNELFGISEERKMTEEERLELYSVMTDEQKNVLKRDVLIHVMSKTSGVNKNSALFLEFVKYHFPDEMAEIESAHNDDYQKKWEVIQAQIAKINSQSEDLQEVA
jgi:hypothetical protein